VDVDFMSFYFPEGGKGFATKYTLKKEKK